MLLPNVQLLLGLGTKTDLELCLVSQQAKSKRRYTHVECLALSLSLFFSLFLTFRGSAVSTAHQSLSGSLLHHSLPSSYFWKYSEYPLLQRVWKTKNSLKHKFCCSMKMLWYRLYQFDTLPLDRTHFVYMWRVYMCIICTTQYTLTKCFQ